MVTLRAMKSDDLPLGLHLSGQAGWNQTETDWQRFLQLQPDGCFVAELDGTSVGTTTTCRFGSIAWIAMVLVDSNSRRRGVGTALLRHAITFLKGCGVDTIRLDATAAGQPVYEPLGFQPDYELTRYEGTPAARPGPPAPSLAKPTQLDELVALDQRMTGTHRARLLRRLFEEPPHATYVHSNAGELQGYLMRRLGRRAVHVGPCIATGRAGELLLGQVLNDCAGRRMYIDVPRRNASALQVVESWGLKVQRHFMRMTLGQRINDQVAALWASSGPEKG